MLDTSTTLWLLLVVVSLVLLYKVFQTNVKGKIGEGKIAIVLSFLSSSKYKVLNDVVIDVNGRTSQIDHVVISDYGIFVIETKNYKGRIFGGENSDYWTQVIFQRKEKFYNPIRQNRSHILALKGILRAFPNVKYVSVIVFSSAATIKVNTETKVTYPFELLDFIKGHAQVNLLQDEKERIFETVSLLNSVDNYDRSQHIEAIEQKIRKREESIERGRCPRCGKQLLERRGKYGSFIGCSGFPSCKFTSQT
jgi:hypothetical protein